MTKRSGKVRRTERYRYLVDDPTEAREALAEVRLAELRARGTDGHGAAKQRLKAAEQAVDDCFGTIVLRALAPDVHQHFVQEFAERDDAHTEAVKAAEEAEQPLPERPEPTWTADSVEVRLLAACDLDNDHTEKWWASEFAGTEWHPTERDELLELCFKLNLPRSAYDLGVLGKG